MRRAAPIILLLLILCAFPPSAFAPRIPGLLERIQQPLYDRNTVATSGTSQLNFFQVPLGGTAAGSTQPATQVQTNMDQGGSLPYPKNFEIHAIRLIDQYDSAASDLNAIYDSSWFNLFIGTNDYTVVNTFLLTSGVGLDGILSVSDGRPDQRGIYTLAEPIDLIPQQNFHCEVNFPTPHGPAGDVNVDIYLDGFFRREPHGGGADIFADNVGARGGRPGVSSRDVIVIETSRPQNDRQENNNNSNE